MYRLLKLSNLALLVLNCLMAFFVFRALTESPAESNVALLSSAGEEDAGSPEPRAVTLTTDKHPSYYADSILSTGRKVFRPQVPVDEFASEDGQSAANQVLGAFRLTGVMLGEDSHQAVLVDTRSGNILFVKEGKEVVDGVLLEKVDRNTATLRVDETTKKIVLYEDISTDRK